MMYSLQSRRGLLVRLMAAAAVPGASRLFAAQNFWNSRKPEEWSSQEVHTLLTRSPWAKEVHVELKAAARGGYDGRSATPGVADDDPMRRNDPSQTDGRTNRPFEVDNRGLGSGAPMPGIAATDGQLPGQIGDATRGGDGKIPMEALAATVRWESAQPLVDAVHTRFPPEFADHYVISVSGLPAFQGKEFLPGDEGQIERFKGAASLQAKGKTAYQPGAIRRSPSGMWFGFAKEFMPLTASDRDITFVLRTNQVELRAKFDPKEMLYQGKPAL
jgi:hypothetical protein